MKKIRVFGRLGILLISIILVCGCLEDNSQTSETVSQETVKDEQTDEGADSLQKEEDSEVKEESSQTTENITLSNIVDTGQNKCYDSINQISCPEEGEAFFGQDAQYLGNNPSYKDNDDGTVTDLNTGLMWTKNAGEKQDYKDIEGISYAGYDDWRLPTVKELYTLMDFRGTDPNPMDTSEEGLVPYIDTEYFDFEYGNTSAGDRIIDSQWATSSIYVSKVMNNEECFFGVNFADGRIKCYPTQKGKGYFVRYVRGELADNDFTDNGDKTITDKSSGLMWQQKDSGKGMVWEDALAYCENLEFADYLDWRLPNAKELQYIVDYSKSPDTTNSGAIDSVFGVSSITNEGGDKDYPFYWTSTTHLSQNAQAAVYVSFGRALGYMNGKWIDVHGAGAQRSDPKNGTEADFPQYHGPQGDVQRVYNYVRCVRNGAELVDVESEAKRFDVQQPPANASSQSSEPQGGLGSPPQEAINACSGKSEDDNCEFTFPQGKESGTCRTVNNQLACVPAGGPPPNQ